MFRGHRDMETPTPLEKLNAELPENWIRAARIMPQYGCLHPWAVVHGCPC